MALEDDVILVDELDHPIGSAPKMRAHHEGLLHRAFSIFIFHPNGSMLIQRRALNKYHSAGLWTNACCSHPRVGEQTHVAAERRLMEEMGMQGTFKEPVSRYLYRCAFPNGLVEFELDYLYTLTTSAHPLPDAAEVMDWRWVNERELIQEIKAAPEQFTFWFRNIMEQGLITFPNRAQGS